MNTYLLTEGHQRLETLKRRRNLMSKLLRTSVVALALIAGASSAMAQSNEPVPDNNDEYGGYPPNSQEGSRQFWQQFEESN
jgi:hypothetical protein